ncbi:g4750 [Coccomyxa elongata]
MAASGAMLRATTLSFMVLVVSMLLISQYAEAQNIKTVTGGGNPGNPTSSLTPPPPPFIPFFPHGEVPQGTGSLPSCPFPMANGASTTFSATYNGQGVACYNVATSTRNCVCPDIFKISACCQGSTCSYDQTTQCNSCCQSPGAAGK